MRYKETNTFKLLAEWLIGHSDSCPNEWWRDGEDEKDTCFDNCLNCQSTREKRKECIVKYAKNITHKNRNLLKRSVKHV